MENNELARQLSRVLAGALSLLLQGAEAATAEIGTRFGAAAWELAVQCWKRLRAPVAARDGADEAARELADKPDDDDLRGAFAVQLRRLLDRDPSLARELATLVEQAPPEARYRAEGHGQSVIAQDHGVAARQVAVGHDVNGNVINLYVNAPVDPTLLAAIIHTTPPADLARAGERFLTHLVDRYRRLDLRGMGVTDRIALHLDLLDLYVPLHARRHLPEGETWARELKVAGRAPSPAETEAMGGRLSDRLPVLDLVREHDGVVILGDPGAGKTTFLKFLTLALATGQGEKLGLGQRVPVLLPLAAYASAPANLPIERFIASYYREQRGIELPLDGLLAQVLDRGAALLLLDGLDEIRDSTRRRGVVDRVVDFYVARRRQGNKFVISSRIIGYPEVRPKVEGLAECTLTDFEDPDIEAFIERWSGAIERALRGDTAVATGEAQRECKALRAALKRSPGVRALAANPLLLTVLALMKRQGVELPERRVELYDKYVEVLIKHWNLARSLAADRAGKGLDSSAVVRVLAPLAYWMQETSPGIGLVPEQALHRRLSEILAERGEPEPEAGAERFLDDLRREAGLLLDRGGRRYGFIHLTFQEYLAAVAVARRGQQGIEPVVAALAEHIDAPAWHEVALLAVGHLGIVQQREEAAGAVLETLIERAPGKPGAAVVLAGEALADAGRGVVGAATERHVSDALRATLRAAPTVGAPMRCEAGRVLGTLGDRRSEAMTLDGMQFCRIPAGAFEMGSNADDADSWDDERPRHRVEIPYEYWLGRYPVTVAQFRAYVEASGRTPQDEDSLKGSANTPVAWVSWDEATAFCAWLSEGWSAVLPAGWRVALPSEAEWEQAARGGLRVPKQATVRVASEIASDVETAMRDNERPAQRYPWGDEADPERANYDETGIGAVSVVGCFPEGASPYGCEELSGNVWEWTRSLWVEDYPYPPPGPERKARESLEVEGARVVRGGGYFRDRRGVRCASRDNNAPVYRLDFIGFRVVVSPFFSER